MGRTPQTDRLNQPISFINLTVRVAVANLEAATAIRTSHPARIRVAWAAFAERFRSDRPHIRLKRATWIVIRFWQGAVNVAVHTPRKVRVAKHPSSPHPLGRVEKPNKHGRLRGCTFERSGRLREVDPRYRQNGLERQLSKMAIPRRFRNRDHKTQKSVFASTSKGGRPSDFQEFDLQLPKSCPTSNFRR